MINFLVISNFRRCFAERFDGSNYAITLDAARKILICVGLQLSVTAIFPGQGWSMSMGMVGLCLIGAATTWQIGRGAVGQDSFAKTVVTGIFILWAMTWLTLVYEVNFRESEQLLSSIFSFCRQILMILFLVPRGSDYGRRWPILLDLVLGIVLCGVLTGTLWPQAFAGRLFAPDTFQFVLGHGIYGVLAISSYWVQRRSAPMFLKAFAITQGIYSLTSILSIAFTKHLGWSHNSLWWVYGDTALIAYPLIASFETRRRVVRSDMTEPNLVPNYVVPLMMAIVVLCLAFSFAQRQRVLATIVGVASLIIYSARAAYLTRRLHQAQESLIFAGRKQVETTIDMMHEIRSPLASVVLNASALARAEDVPASLKARIDSIAGRCDSVTQLLNEVLDLKRAEAGVEKKFESVANVSAACREALESVATVAMAANVTLDGPCENEAPILSQGDTVLLMRIIVNLLNNAIRFTRSGGSVKVSIRDDGGSQITVVVQDDGVGLSKEARESLFNRFGHAGNPVNGAKGSGLGLSISMSAIESMHGKLSLTARDDGPGTRAIILLNAIGKSTQQVPLVRSTIPGG